MFASIADSLLVLDTELCVVDANDQVLRQLGRAKSDVVGVAWEQLFPHLAETGRVADLRMVLAVGQPHRGRIPVVSAADGTSHLFDVATYPVCDPKTGQVTHLVEYAREITEEVKLQLQVMDATATCCASRSSWKRRPAQIDAANSLLEEKCVSLEEANRRLERLAVLDVMTDLPNHRAFQEQLAYQVRQTQRHHRPFSLIMFDVDNFKQYNDCYGHPDGDQLLAGIARLMRASVRAVDLPARYGGEEFAVILPETDRFGAAMLAERLRAEVAAYPFPNKRVTISVGVAEFPSDAADGGGLVFCADKAMYHAKSSGKNTVSLWRGTGGGTPLPTQKSHEAIQAAIRRCQSVPGLPPHLPAGSASGSRLLLVDQDELSLGTLREALQGVRLRRGLREQRPRGAGSAGRRGRRLRPDADRRGPARQERVRPALGGPRPLPRPAHRLHQLLRQPGGHPARPGRRRLRVPDEAVPQRRAGEPDRRRPGPPRPGLARAGGRRRSTPCPEERKKRGPHLRPPFSVTWRLFLFPHQSSEQAAGGLVRRPSPPGGLVRGRGPAPSGGLVRLGIAPLSRRARLACTRALGANCKRVPVGGRRRLALVQGHQRVAEHPQRPRVARVDLERRLAVRARRLRVPVHQREVGVAEKLVDGLSLLRGQRRGLRGGLGGPAAAEAPCAPAAAAGRAPRPARRAGPAERSGGPVPLAPGRRRPGRPAGWCRTERAAPGRPGRGTPG